MAVDRTLHHAKIATNGVPSCVDAIAIQGGKLGAAGANDEILVTRF